MAALGYHWLQQAIVASHGDKSTLAVAVGRDSRPETGREIGRLQLQIQEITLQRVDDVSLTFGNVARILATRT